QYKYFAQEYRRQSGAWTVGARINLPGVLEQAFLHDGERRLLTRDDVYSNDSVWSQSQRLHLLAARGRGARQLDSHTFDQLWVSGWMREGERLYLTGADTTNQWDWSTSGRVILYDLAAGRFDETFRAPTGGYW